MNPSVKQVKKKKSKKKNLTEEIISVIRNSRIDKRKNISINNLTYSEFLADEMLKNYVIEQGVPYFLFNSIQARSPFTNNDWAVLLGISPKTLQRYRYNASRYFKPIQSEKIIEMAEVIETGLDVFGDMNKFKQWLDTPDYGLGNNKPIDLLSNSYGQRMVIEVLRRAEHGIFI
jgi:putative toxin-antitoxin system antitoxin component (TIGR02293 family)